MITEDTLKWHCLSEKVISNLCSVHSVMGTKNKTETRDKHWFRSAAVAQLYEVNCDVCWHLKQGCFELPTECSLATVVSWCSCWTWQRDNRLETKISYKTRTKPSAARSQDQYHDWQYEDQDEVLLVWEQSCHRTKQVQTMSLSPH